MSAPQSASEVFQFIVDGDPRLLSEPETDPDTGAKIDRIIVGRELARTVGLKVSDVATIISPQGHLTPVGLAPRYRDFKVAGIFESGLSDYDETWAYISLEAAHRLSGPGDVARTFKMKGEDAEAGKRTAPEGLAGVGGELEGEGAEKTQ